jgi:hypothetical protein
MALPVGLVGTELEPVTVRVERGSLLFFARATGQSDPVYTDVTAARAAGHPDLPAPPTYLFGLELRQPDPFAFLSGAGVDLRRVLHGEQFFAYHRTAHAGDTLVLRPTISDVYSKRGGSLGFVVKKTAVARSDGQPVADLRTVIVLRDGQESG